MNISVTRCLTLLSMGLLMTLTACVEEATPTPVPATSTPMPTPTATPIVERQDGAATPTSVSRITENQAIARALEMLTGPMPEVTGVQNPRNPVARLMTLGEYEEQYFSGGSALDPATLVWVVQIEGKSEDAGIVPPSERKQYRYSVEVLDAQTGRSIAGSRGLDPIFPEGTCIPLPFALFDRSPWPGTTDVPLTQPISVSISRPAQIVELTTEPNIVIANVNMEYVSVASGKYTFYPAEPLQPLMTYTAMVTYGQREAAEGRCPTSVVIWQFTTGLTPTGSPPPPTPTPTAFRQKSGVSPSFNGS